ncbi:MAG TPA: flagellar hook protein FlgE [Candidatus Dormibacteraeota bacterium]|nr:flagellar hook protein FlgE [Candidatus Dormibacteraeota bacterium]
MFDSLFTGVTGLNAYQADMNVISNNIANVGTTGFKSQNMTFQDLLYQSYRYASAPTQTNGGVNPQDVGLGVKVGTIETDFSQGGLQTTGVNSDLAINGNGYFVLANTSGGGNQVYTRDGAFTLSSQGMLIDPGSGLAVQGYMANAQGQITQTGTPNSITIPLGLTMQAQQTNNLYLGGNNDSSQYALTATGTNNAATTNAASTVVNGVTAPTTADKILTTTVYDSLGNAHQLTITLTPLPAASINAAGGAFGTVDPVTSNVSGTSSYIAGALPSTVTNTASGSGPVTPATRFAYTVTAVDGTSISPAAGELTPGGYVYFDANGQFIGATNAAPTNEQQTTVAASSATLNASAPLTVGNTVPLTVSLWGPPNSPPTTPGVGATPNNAAAPTTVNLDWTKATALASPYTTAALTQDGYQAGVLNNFSVSQDGSIQGQFSNGQVKTLAQVAVATFANNGGLQRIGSNQFEATANSGLPVVGAANAGSAGAIVSGALEQSNVSLADQFTKMIVAQNAFTANSRTIATSDQMQQTVVNLLPGTG